MSITSLPPLGAGEIPGPMIGLFLIALGTGGIKPCVSAFGGDQFTSDQTHLLQSFFSVFYFAINAGSLLSMLITPVLRGNVKLYNNIVTLYRDFKRTVFDFLCDVWCCHHVSTHQSNGVCYHGFMSCYIYQGLDKKL